MPKKEVDFYPQIFECYFDEDEMPSKVDKNAKKPCPLGMNCKNIKTKTCRCVHPCDGLKRGEYVLVSDKLSRYRVIKNTPCPSDTLTAVPVIKKTPCPSDTLTAVPDMKTQFLMLCSRR
jgi:hypothetical protein